VKKGEVGNNWRTSHIGELWVRCHPERPFPGIVLFAAAEC
jgi:hypothetical protein